MDAAGILFVCILFVPIIAYIVVGLVCIAKYGRFDD